MLPSKENGKAFTGRRCRRPWPACLCLTLLALVQAVPVRADSSSRSPQPIVQPTDPLSAVGESQTCGVRAAFLLGRSCGLTWSYDEVRALLPASESGTSFAAIQEVLQDHGVSCSLRRMGPAELASAHTPMILFLRPGYVATQIGHFMLMESISDRGPVLLDPITGRSQSWRWRTFSDAWTGYALQPTNYGEVASTTTRVAVLHLCVLLLFLGVALRGRPLWAGSKSPDISTTGDNGTSGNTPWGRALARLLLLPGLCLIPETVSAGEEIRSLHRDGRNSALILASLAGGELSDLPDPTDSSEAAQWSFLDIQKLCEQLFCPTELRTLTYEDLVTMQQPAVALLRQDDDGGGQFCVVLRADSEVATLLYSGPVVVQDLGVDEFRRRWTGHALLPLAPPSRWRSGLFVAAIAGGVAALMLRQIFRRGRMSTDPT